MENRCVNFMVLDMKAATVEGLVPEKLILKRGVLNLDEYDSIKGTFIPIFFDLMMRNIEKIYLCIAFRSYEVHTPEINVLESDPNKVGKTFSDLSDLFCLVFANGKKGKKE